MAFYAVYDDDGTILKTIECPEFMINKISETISHNILQIDRVADDKTEVIKDGQLVKKTEAT